MTDKVTFDNATLVRVSTTYTTNMADDWSSAAAVTGSSATGLGGSASGAAGVFQTPATPALPSVGFGASGAALGGASGALMGFLTTNAAQSAETAKGKSSKADAANDPYPVKNLIKALQDGKYGNEFTLEQLNGLLARAVTLRERIENDDQWNGLLIGRKAVGKSKSNFILVRQAAISPCRPAVSNKVIEGTPAGTPLTYNSSRIKAEIDAVRKSKKKAGAADKPATKKEKKDALASDFGAMAGAAADLDSQNIAAANAKKLTKKEIKDQVTSRSEGFWNRYASLNLLGAKAGEQPGVARATEDFGGILSRFEGHSMPVTVFHSMLLNMAVSNKNVKLIVREILRAALKRAVPIAGTTPNKVIQDYLRFLRQVFLFSADGRISEMTHNYALLMSKYAVGPKIAEARAQMARWTSLDVASIQRYYMPGGLDQTFAKSTNQFKKGVAVPIKPKKTKDESYAAVIKALYHDYFLQMNTVQNQLAPNHATQVLGKLNQVAADALLSGQVSSKRMPAELFMEVSSDVMNAASLHAGLSDEAKIKRTHALYYRLAELILEHLNAPISLDISADFPLYQTGENKKLRLRDASGKDLNSPTSNFSKFAIIEFMVYLSGGTASGAENVTNPETRSQLQDVIKQQFERFKYSKDFMAMLYGAATLSCAAH